MTEEEFTEYLASKVNEMYKSAYEKGRRDEREALKKHYLIEYIKTEGWLILIPDIEDTEWK